jgi:nucleotide-binding universal stress UspA family protein
MYNAIVVGTDGSDRAAVAVRHALNLAKMSGATLHVVHAVRPVSTSMMGAEYIDPTTIATTRSAMRDEGDQICARVGTEAEGERVSAEMHNVDGDPADVLITVSEDVQADLVVVGNRGMSGIKRFALGSIPNKVAHRSSCSVLIVDTDRA